MLCWPPSGIYLGTKRGPQEFLAALQLLGSIQISGVAGAFALKAPTDFTRTVGDQPRDNKLMAQDDSAKLESLPQLSTMPAIVEHWRQHHQVGAKVANVRFGGTLSVNVTVDPYPDVLLQAAVTILGDRIAEGQIVEGVSLAWFEIISHIESDPDFLFKIPARRVEEIVAGAYERAGWEVILTPRSGDRGRDVIATRSGVISIRIVDQIKVYRLGHLITADEVRSMLGVLHIDRNVSKGLVTTTGRFAPGIEKDRGIIAFMPYRLNLKNGDQLRHGY